MITLNCLECKSSFEAKRSTAKFCSDNCRVKHNNNPANKITDIEVPDIPVFKAPPQIVVTKKGLELRPSAEKMAAVRVLMDKINKDFGAGSVMMLGDKPLAGIEVISTGSLGLDIALGVQGLPKGRIVEIYGWESSGKTTLALHVIAEAQKAKGSCAFIDAEHAFDANYAKSLGVNVDDLLVCQPDYGEQALEFADQFVTSGLFSVVVVDSVAALIPKGELENNMGDSRMGAQARLMSQACRKMVGTIHKTNTLVIFINQLREKIGVMFGNPEVVPGGNALKFYSSVRLDVRRSTTKDNSTTDSNGHTTGNLTKVKVIKNKVSPPFRTCEFDILYGIGIDKIGEIIDFGVEHGVIKKSGAHYSYKDSKIGQGKEQVRQFLTDNEEVKNEIEIELITLLKTI